MNKYTQPEMIITVFNKENILTASALKPIDIVSPEGFDGSSGTPVQAQTYGEVPYGDVSSLFFK